MSLDRAPSEALPTCVLPHDGPGAADPSRWPRPRPSRAHLHLSHSQSRLQCVQNSSAHDLDGGEGVSNAIGSAHRLGLQDHVIDSNENAINLVPPLLAKAESDKRLVFETRWGRVSYGTAPSDGVSNRAEIPYRILLSRESGSQKGNHLFAITRLKSRFRPVLSNRQPTGSLWVDRRTGTQTTCVCRVAIVRFK